MPQHSDALVFSHNDLLANNILIRLIDGGINFIDFEYSAYNYRAFDIANFIVESSFDYMNPNPPFYFIGSHPDDEVINDFIKYYSYAATLIS